MMRFQVFLSLWSVTSCSWIDKIPEVAKNKAVVLNPWPVTNPKAGRIWICAEHNKKNTLFYKSF